MRSLPAVLLLTAVILLSWGGCLLASQLLPFLAMPPAFSRVTGAVAAFVLLLWGSFLTYSALAGAPSASLDIKRIGLPLTPARLQLVVAAVGVGLSLAGIVWLALLFS